MTGAGRPARPPGRPRSQEADQAILSAALDLLIEQGAALTSIEQVARRAGVTRATVYRRFADKTALLVRTLEWANHDHDPAITGWRDLEHMFADWAAYLAVPRNRRLLRRLYGSVDDYPELVTAYRSVNGGRRAAAVRETLSRACATGTLPRELDLDVVQELLSAAVVSLATLGPENEDPERIAAHFMAIMKQLGHRRQAG